MYLCASAVDLGHFFSPLGNIMSTLAGNRRAGRIPNLYNMAFILCAGSATLGCSHQRCEWDPRGTPIFPEDVLPGPWGFWSESGGDAAHRTWSVTWFRLSRKARMCSVNFGIGRKRLFSMDSEKQDGEQLSSFAGFCVFREAKSADICRPAACLQVLNFDSPWSSTIKRIWSCVWSIAPRHDLNLLEREFLCCSNGTLMAFTVRLLYFTLLRGIICSLGNTRHWNKSRERSCWCV